MILANIFGAFLVENQGNKKKHCPQSGLAAKPQKKKGGNLAPLCGATLPLSGRKRGQKMFAAKPQRKKEKNILSETNRQTSDNKQLTGYY